MNAVHEFQMYPETEMTFRLPHNAKVLGLVTRPARLRIEADDSVQPQEMRVFRLVTPVDVDTFDTTGWTHVHTSLIGGENHHDMWYTVHVWEFKLGDELDSLEIERQLLERP
jgi:hypothetical protein